LVIFCYFFIIFEAMKKIADLVPGDLVERNMLGIKMGLRVSHVDAQLVHCGPWTFDRETGAEVDEDLSISCSRIRSLTPLVAAR
jgi:hypothetical protein